MLEQAHRDSLTGFFLREALLPLLEQLIRDAQTTAKFFSVALLDLDHFKKFNDKHGHAFGDEILKYTTSTLRLTFYESQCQFFRYGGDEFIAVFPDKDPKETWHLIRQCHYNLHHRPFLFQNKFYRVTLSSGIVGFPSDAKTVEELIRKADEAMYFSKRRGRNAMTLFSKITFLKLRRILTRVGVVVFLAVVMLVVYQLSFKKIIKPTISQIQHIKIVTKPEHLDTVILKNGMSFEGIILSETQRQITMNIYFDKGQGITMFNKSELTRIVRAPKTAPQE